MKDIVSQVKGIIPPLTSERKKGENGRVAVIGGSYEFTGAPYYAAMSALKGGADMAHIFCSKSAATPIKAYSPEIVVHPVFTLSQETDKGLNNEELELMWESWIQKIFAWENAITSWVVGPGLGRDPYMQGFFQKLVRRFKAGTIVVFDADGIYFLSKNPDLLKWIGELKAILTPNQKQFTYIQKFTSIKPLNLQVFQSQSSEFVCLPDYQHKEPFGVVLKGRMDTYLNSQCSCVCTTEGSSKRCGGIGDILSGLVGAYAFWDMTFGPLLACVVSKRAAKAAFQKQKRSLTAPGVLAQIHFSFDQVEKMMNSSKQASL